MRMLISAWGELRAANYCVESQFIKTFIQDIYLRHLSDA